MITLTGVKSNCMAAMQDTLTAHFTVTPVE